MLRICSKSPKFIKPSSNLIVTLGILLLTQLVACSETSDVNASENKPTSEEVSNLPQDDALNADSTESSDDESLGRVVWRGNDTLGQSDWKQAWGLVAWSEQTGSLTNGFWGENELDVVADPYDPDHKVLRVYYPQNQNTNESGVGMLFQPEMNLANEQQACLSYNMLFDYNFEFGTVGGKIPGLYGFNYSSGEIPDATYCAGPYEYDPSICFSARYSYRNIPAVARYSDQMYYEIIPWMDETQCRENWICELSSGEGMVIKAAQPELTEAKKSQWTNIRQEIKLNDEGSSNGYIRVWYENNLIYNEENIIITQGGEVPINGILFHALFGQGFDLSQGSPVSQYSYFADFAIADNCDVFDESAE